MSAPDLSLTSNYHPEKKIRQEARARLEREQCAIEGRLRGAAILVEGIE